MIWAKTSRALVSLTQLWKACASARKHSLNTLPDGRRRPARRALTGGDDAVGSIIDDTYSALTTLNHSCAPAFQSLRNEEEISIVACPGRTSAALQNRVIEHANYCGIGSLFLGCPAATAR